MSAEGAWLRNSVTSAVAMHADAVAEPADFGGKLVARGGGSLGGLLVHRHVAHGRGGATDEVDRFVYEMSTRDAHGHNTSSV